jgi:hypothetical protein
MRIEERWQETPIWRWFLRLFVEDIKGDRGKAIGMDFGRSADRNALPQWRHRSPTDIKEFLPESSVLRAATSPSVRRQRRGNLRAPHWRRPLGARTMTVLRRCR